MKLLINFHDIVGITIEAENHAREFFAAEYAHHMSNALPENAPQILLRFQQKKRVSPPPGYTLHIHKALARWAYRIQFAPRRIEINVIGNRASIPMVHHMMLHPSLRYLAAKENVLMLHAGAVTYGEQSLILTGHGGAGKTTTTSVLLDMGGKEWGLHADDYVFLAEGPRSLAYLTRAHLYLPLLKWIPDLSSRLTLLERLRLEIFGRARAWTKERIKLPVRLDLQRLWAEHPFVQSAIPAALILLERADVPSPQAIPLNSDDFPLNALIEMNFQEARHFIHLVRKSNAVPNADSWLETWRKRERNLLNARGQEIRPFVLRLPKNINDLATARQQVQDGVASILQRSTP